MSRIISIADIHGCLLQFNKLLNNLNLQKEDTLILHGDYVDRGPDSKGVIERILELKKDYKVLTLKGNHEDLMLKGLTGSPDDMIFWMQCGGYETLKSYGYDIKQETFDVTLVSKTHLEFLLNLSLYHETDSHIYVHASPSLTMDLSAQEETHLIWRRPSCSDEELDFKHISGKTIVCGHTVTSKNKPTVYDKYIFLDTGCVFGGKLTAYDSTNNLFITDD